MKSTIFLYRPLSAARRENSHVSPGDNLPWRKTNPWLWIPLAAGVFGTVVPIMVGAKKNPSRADLITYFVTMLVLMGVGMLGFILHVYQDLMFSYEIVPERFIRGAPFLAPMLFADTGMIGLVVLLNPNERKKETSDTNSV